MDCIVNKTTRFGNLRHPPWHPRCRHFDMMSIAFPDVLQFDLNLYISDVGPSSHRHSANKATGSIRQCQPNIQQLSITLLWTSSGKKLDCIAVKSSNTYPCWRWREKNQQVCYAGSAMPQAMVRRAWSCILEQPTCSYATAHELLKTVRVHLLALKGSM